MTTERLQREPYVLDVMQGDLPYLLCLLGDSASHECRAPEATLCVLLSAALTNYLEMIVCGRGSARDEVLGGREMDASYFSVGKLGPRPSLLQGVCLVPVQKDKPKGRL